MAYSPLILEVECGWKVRVARARILCYYERRLADLHEESVE